MNNNNNTTYKVTGENGSVSVKWNEIIEIIDWDSVCPDSEVDADFENETDYITDLASYYNGELPSKVFEDVVFEYFGPKIADVLNHS